MTEESKITKIEKAKKLWEIINSPIVIFILTLILISVLGSIINNQFQEEAWKRQEDYKKYKRQSDDALQVIEDTLLDANRLFYSMNEMLRYILSCRPGAIDFRHLEYPEDIFSKSTSLEEAKKRWEEYGKIKYHWDVMVGSYSSKIKNLIGPDLSYELLDKETAGDYGNKEDLNTMFLATHSKLENLLNWYALKELFNTGTIPESSNLESEKELVKALTDLKSRLKDFSDSCYKAYFKKYNDLKSEDN